MLVTCALPYANGPLHLGHMLEYIQADIWVRFHKMLGHTCYFVCADDTHGTPIMLRADLEGISPEELIARVGHEHREDLAAYAIGFDHFYTTHSPENRHFCELIFSRLKEKDLIAQKNVEQLFDPEAKLFLPDRFITGECPRCHAQDQYGDSCEACGATYSPTELIHPRSVVTGATPVLRTSEHYFFLLSQLEDFLRDWVEKGHHLQPETRKKLEEWFAVGLADWDISRDAPYFGFEIPEAPGKYFYVWLDAPIGYMASFRKYAADHGLDFDAFWGQGSDAELVHFIGKDILYFHGLFWPAMLHFSGFRAPSKIFCHGFLTVEGKKMSKSRGTFVTASDFRAHLHPELLRYYFACKLPEGIEDIDLGLKDFQARVNADVVGKYVNLASRAAALLERHFGGCLAQSLDEPALIEEMREAQKEIGSLYEERRFSLATRAIMHWADRANQYFDGQKPWELARDPHEHFRLQRVCTTAINAFRLLSIFLKPVLPLIASRAEAFLGVPPFSWGDAAAPLLGKKLFPYTKLASRVEDSALLPLLPKEEPAKEEPSPHLPLLDIEDFSRIDLRIGKVLSASEVEGSDKLLKLLVDVGEEKPRCVFAGIRKHYPLDALLGRLVVVAANLKPRKMRFGVSEAMVLAAGDGEGVYLLGPEAGAVPGMKVR